MEFTYGTIHTVDQIAHRTLNRVDSYCSKQYFQSTHNGVPAEVRGRVISMNGYRRRIINDTLDELFPSFVAISSDAARAIGKTSTGR